MSFRLARLRASEAMVDAQQRPTLTFQRWWQSVMEKIEATIDTVLAALVRLGAVEIQADGTATLAESAINPGGTIKDDKVLTSSMIDNAATVISSLFRDDGGSALGTAGSYVDLPGGAAVISIATGTKAAQQCFVDAWIGVRRGGGANEIVTFRCRRNDGTILAQTYDLEATNDQQIMPMAFLDPSPGASATHTYTVQANSADAGTEIREVFVKGLLGRTG